ncbi:MAG: hypothetical protein EOP46_08750 [Sphingobacteriaceae bacterium]|nr:MAG: hypothetical protein EOP46_08750 [Sphingobacteriaceae bacterium]
MRAEDEDFKTTKLINAPIGYVFNTLTTLDGLTANWQENTEEENGVYRNIILEHDNGVKSTLKINIQLPQLTQWTVVSDTDLNSDLQNTIIRFELEDMGDETCTLHFMHIGLTPELENYQTHVSGWEHFINNIVHHCEHTLVN